MKKYIILILVLITGQFANADLLHGDNYVSPERYAVNESDMQIDYSKIPAAPKIDIDKLDDMRFQAPNLVEKDFSIGKDEEKNETITNNTENLNNKKLKKQKKKKEKEVIGADEAYKKKLPYKVAKWWVDKRYEREEPHHGTLHEIKVQKRIDYENKLEQEAKEKLSN